MKLFTRTKFIGPIGLIVATAGAGTAIAAEPEEASRQAPAPSRCPGLEESQGPSATLGHRASHEAEAQQDPTGPLALVGDALQKVCLSDEQRDAIENLGDQVRPKEESVMHARQALRKALFEQLKSGKIDERALRSEIDALVKAREEASPVLRKALEELHGILDSGQREAFVDALESRMKELKEGSEGWREQLAKDLGLSEEQKQRLEEVLSKGKPALEEERSRARKVFDGFKKDDFSIEQIAPVGDVGERTRKRAEGMIGIAKELVGVLSPAQRDELARKIEEHRAKMGRHEERATTSAEPDDEEVGDMQEAIVVARGGAFRAGGVRGWGGGYARGGYVGGVRYGGGYVARGAVARTGYAAGYPLAVGYGPGIW